MGHSRTGGFSVLLLPRGPSASKGTTWDPQAWVPDTLILKTTHPSPRQPLTRENPVFLATPQGWAKAAPSSV